MNTSHVNRVAPDTIVTPDAVIQLSNGLGYVVEAKKSLPLNSDYWVNEVEQLQKYDDDLTGWWIEPAPMVCIVLLLHYSRSVKFINYLRDQLDQGKVIFQKKVSVVEFVHEK